LCGVNAIYAYRASAPLVDRLELEQVRDAMTTRGPDGAGTWIAADGRVGLGHRRLSIIDLDARAAQPMASGDGKCHISFNGEIYNYRALRDELARDGHVFRTQSDTEVLLALYQRDGHAMVDRLRGMYAFALWDDERRGMLLARDPFGIKPLYLADDGGTIRVASQVKALLVGSGIDRAPSAAGRCGFFLLGYVPAPHTLYRGIHELPAGTTTWIASDGSRTERRHFDLTAVLAEAEQRSRDAAPGELRDLIVDSVRHHLVADVEVGVFLSAGIDSTTLTALASEIQSSQLRTLTLAFDEYRGRAEDEAPLAEQVAAHYGSRHETHRIPQTVFKDALSRVLIAMDQPTTDGMNSWLVSGVAAAAGLKVAISGLGGDEMFAGYPSFKQVPRLANTLAPLAHAPVLGRWFRAATAPLARRLTSPKYAGLIEYGTNISDAWLLRRALYLPWELADVVGADMAAEGLADLALRDRLADAVRPLRSARMKLTALEAGWYMRGQLLRDADWAGMAHSVEIRVPLVDGALFRGLAPLAAAALGVDKRDLAATPMRPLPSEVVTRPKTGFSVPLREWFTGEVQARGTAHEHRLRGYARMVMARFEDS
jgi:asparagine synthase (glutamine-hydrolysing)